MTRGSTQKAALYTSLDAKPTTWVGVFDEPTLYTALGDKTHI